MIADNVKHGKNPLASIRIKTLFLIVGLALSGCSEQSVKPEVANHLVLMVDASGSYKARQSEAIARAIVLLEGMSKTKLKRWESTSDKIFIISLDASPDTIWQGSLKELKTKRPDFWKERFVARTDYASCTDVSGAFRLAAKHLEGDSRYISKYLLVFSDMLHEPPTNNMRACQSPVRVSPQDFPWVDLGDVSVSVFWMPPDQKLLWRKAARDRGMEANFALYTVSESPSAPIPEPPRPKEKITDEERKTQKDKIVSGARSLAFWLFVIFGSIMLMIVVGFLFQRYRGQRSPVTPQRRRP